MIITKSRHHNHFLALHDEFLKHLGFAITNDVNKMTYMCLPIMQAKRQYGY